MIARLHTHAVGWCFSPFDLYGRADRSDRSLQPGCTGDDLCVACVYWVLVPNLRRRTLEPLAKSLGVDLGKLVDQLLVARKTAEQVWEKGETNPWGITIQNWGEKLPELACAVTYLKSFCPRACVCLWIAQSLIV